MFEKRSEPRFPTRNHYFRFCGRKKVDDTDARRRGRRRKKLLDDLKDRRGYSHLKEEDLDRTTWRQRFGGGFELVVRQNTK